MRRRSKNKCMGYVYFIKKNPLEFQDVFGEECLVSRYVNFKKILHRNDVTFYNGFEKLLLKKVTK
jgi:hypothetical protein